MRFLNKNIVISLSAISIMAAAFVGCDDEQAEKWVDLRYRVEDAYLVEAKDPKPITFQVKSTDKWEVFGKYDWHTITPNSGEPGEAYDVTVQCKENTDLDDRIDTISIKSDYWTGKTFVLTQKGIAYLDFEVDYGDKLDEYGNPIKDEHGNPIKRDNISEFGGTAAIKVLANQKWTAKVTEGDAWLSIEGSSEGELDGAITVNATPNAGEMRTGKVTLYDRHSKPVQVVECVQGGKQLDPEIPENGAWFQLYEEAQQLTIHVESNAEWTVRKENEADETWYDFAKTEFSGSDDIVVNLTENEGSRVRTGVIILSTKAEAGATPVVKYVKFKQANPKIPVVTELNKTLAAGESYYGPGSLMPGRYNFYINPFAGADINLFFMWNGSTPYAELRWHVIGGKTKLSTTPWSSNVHNDMASNTVDATQANVLSWDIQKYVDENDPTKVWIYTEWILNNEIIAKCISDGFTDGTQSSDTWKVPFDQISAGGNFMLRAVGSSVTISKYEYVAPLEWGD